MREPKGPCKGCEIRTVEDPEKGTHDCHDRCGQYQEYRQKLMEYRRKVYTAQIQEKIVKSRPWMKRNSKAQNEYRREAERDRKK